MSIATIAESIFKTMEIVKALEQQADIDKREHADIAAQRMAKADKERQDLLQNLSTLQQNISAATKCRKDDLNPRVDVHCFEIRYMLSEKVKMVGVKHQAQAIIKCLIKVGHSVISDYSI